MTKIQYINIPTFRSRIEAHHEYVGIDIRPTHEFMNGFIPETLHLPISKIIQQKEAVIQNKKIIIIAENNLTEQQISDIAALDLPQAVFALEGGISAWEEADEPLDVIIDIEVDEFILDYKFDDNILLLDARKEDAYAQGHIAKAHSFPVAHLGDIIYTSDLDLDKNIYVYCGGGSSAVLVASFFKRQGIHNVYVLSSGYNALADSGAFDIMTSKHVLDEEADKDEAFPDENA